MALLNPFFQFFVLLNSETSKNSIATGLSLGLLLALMPFNVLWTILVFAFVLFFKINGASFFTAWAVFKLFTWALDPLLAIIGFEILNLDFLGGLFTWAYNAPIVPWSNFNNTIMAGGAILGFALFLPSFFIFRFLIERYRTGIYARFTKLKWVKLFKTTKLYKAYAKYQEIKGALS